MRLRRALVAILSVLVVLAVAACGGSSGSSDNGVAAESPQQILTSATNALTGVSSVHVTGAFTSDSVPTTLDLSLVSGKGGRGSMSQNGLGFQLVVIGSEAYINADAAFWRHFGGNAAATLFKGKWLKAPTSGQFGTFASLANVHDLFSMLTGAHGALKKGAVTTVNGQKAVALIDTAKGGTMYVATTGKPYPVAVVQGTSGGGRITFSDFNQPVTLTAPSNAIDISQLK
jgi:hypothetical protein